MATWTFGLTTFSNQANPSAGGAAGNWGSPSNAATSDDSRTSSFISFNADYTPFLRALDPSGSAPGDFAGSTITQIQFKIEGRATQNDGGTDDFAQDAEVYLIVAGSQSGANQADLVSYWSTSESVQRTYTWTTGLPTAAQIDAANFGLDFAALLVDFAAGSCALQIDYIECVVTYTPVGTSITLALAPALTTLYEPSINTSTLPRFGQIYPSRGPDNIIPVPPTPDRLWLKADVGVTYNPVTGLVSQWSDQSGNGFHAVQATGANQPTKSINLSLPGLAGVLPGVHFLRFNGDDFLACASTSALNAGTTDFTVVVVGFCDGGIATATRRTYIEKTPSINSGTQTGWVVGARRGSVNYFWSAMYNSGNAYGYDGPIAATNSGTAVWDAWQIEFKRNPNSITIYRNATEHVIWQTITSTLGATDNLDNSTAYLVGKDTDGDYLIGGIAEIMIYSGTLTATQRKQLNNYLTAKYNKVLGGP